MVSYHPYICNERLIIEFVQTEDCVEAHTQVDVIVDLEEFRSLLESRLPLVFNGTSVLEAALPWPEVLSKDSDSDNNLVMNLPESDSQHSESESQHSGVDSEESKYETANNSAHLADVESKKNPSSLQKSDPDEDTLLSQAESGSKLSGAEQEGYTTASVDSCKTDDGNMGFCESNYDRASINIDDEMEELQADESKESIEAYARSHKLQPQRGDGSLHFWIVSMVCGTHCRLEVLFENTTASIELNLCPVYECRSLTTWLKWIAWCFNCI